MKYVALLRGINVGGNKKVNMAELKVLFESLGFGNVSTYINSGNVIFEHETKPLSDRIEGALSEAFGFDVRVVIRDAANIKTLCKGIPLDWENNKEQKTDVFFLWDEFDRSETLDLIVQTEVNSLKYIDGAIVWHIQKSDYNQSGMNKFIGTKVYKNMTARNINTVRKLGQLMADL